MHQGMNTASSLTQAAFYTQTTNRPSKMNRRVVSSFVGPGFCQPLTRPNFRLISSTSVRYKKSTKQAHEQRPIEVFFAKHPGFHHDMNRTVWDEFNSLCAHYKWSDSDTEKRQAKLEFQKALVAEFKKLYGTDSKSLRSWQTLCEAIQISPIPGNLEECREVGSIIKFVVEMEHCNNILTRSSSPFRKSSLYM